MLAAVVVLARLTLAWPSAADTSHAAALALVCVSIIVLAAAVLAGAARGDTMRAAADWTLLAAAGVVVAVEQRQAFGAGRTYPSDEGRLVQHAIHAIGQLHNPYAMRFPDVAHFAGNTPFFDGSAAQRFGYPPLSAEVGAGLGAIWSPLGTAAVVGSLAFAATAVVCLVVLPPQWRGLSIALVMGVVPLTTYAVNGHPVVVAVALLCIACAGWTRIGSGGRLGASGIISAACLGLAAAAQQLAWFIGIGLLLSVWLVRRGELADRRAATVAARFAGVALVVFLAVDAPFIIAGPQSWAERLLSLIGLDHPAAAGQGLVMLNVVLRGQGGAFEFYGYASALMLLGVLLMIGIGFRWLAPVVPILLALVFLVSIRSQGEYFLVLTPVWLVWLAGSDPAVIASSRPLGGGRRTRWLLGHDLRRGVVCGCALLPAVACVAVAVATPGPLALAVDSIDTTNSHVVQLRVEVYNADDQMLVPHFYLDPPSHLRSPWRIVSGPRRLRPGQRASFVLRPALLGPERRTSSLRVWALTDNPKTMSSTPLDIAP